MGAMGEAMGEFARLLIDETDGSPEQVQRAFAISMACWNLALTPEDKREASIASFRSTLEMDDDTFASFRNTVILPMIERHYEMFPGLHGGVRRESLGAALRRTAPPPTIFDPRTLPDNDEMDAPEIERERHSKPAARPAAPTLTSNQREDRGNSACPCGSGRKYKKCCGKR